MLVVIIKIYGNMLFILYRLQGNNFRVINDINVCVTNQLLIMHYII